MVEQANRIAEFFNENGFYVAKGLFSEQKVLRIKQTVNLFANLYPEFCVAEKSDADKDKTLLFQSINFVQHSGFFQSLVNDEEFQNLLTMLLGDEGSLFMEAFHYKQPGGGTFEPHQDLQSPVLDWVNKQLNPSEDKIQSIITACIAVDEHTIENGCIEVASGLHTSGLLGKKGENIPKHLYEKMNLEPILLNPGDVLFFHGHTPHGSKTNNSNSERKALMLFYNKQSEGHHHDLAMDYFLRERL